jgi:hypothetical protein
MLVAGLLLLASLSFCDLLNTMAFSEEITVARAAASAGEPGRVCANACNHRLCGEVSFRSRETGNINMIQYLPSQIKESVSRIAQSARACLMPRAATFPSSAV